MSKKGCQTMGVIALALIFASAPFQAFAADPIKLKWAHVYGAGEEYNKWALWAAEQIKARTGGRYQIDVYPSSSLAKEAELLPSIAMGSVDIVYIGSAFLASTYGPIGITEAPFVFENFQHWLNFSKSVYFTELSEGYRKASKGNVITATTYYGARCVTSNKPINTPADMKGLKIRVPGAPLYLMFTEALGANATPIAFAEVYLALQQKVVDAQENPLPTIQAQKFNEVQKYINMTQHITANIFTVIGSPTWNKIGPADQKIFIEVTKEAAEKCSLAISKAEGDLVAWFEKQGNIINRVDRKPFIDAVAPSLKSSPRMTWTLDDYNKIMALK